MVSLSASLFLSLSPARAFSARGICIRRVNAAGIPDSYSLRDIGE